MTGFLPTRVIDAGYISWLYGPTPEGVNAWNLEKLKYRKDLLVLDSPRSFREEHWSEYKANRRVDTTPEQEIRLYMVKSFRDKLAQDHLLTTVRVDGLEADDVISVLALYTCVPEIQVIGVDKDYLQLPRGLKMMTLSGEVKTLEAFQAKLPKTIQGAVTRPLDVLFTLALMGDAIDNIPRLIPPRKLDQFLDIMEPTEPGDRIVRALAYFGDDFARNVYLAVLPGPWVYDPVPGPQEVLDHLSGGTYWTQVLSPGVRANVLGTFYSRYPFEGATPNG
jgi:hypothetical protein